MKILFQSRQYNVVLPVEGAGWRLPDGAHDVTVYVNGLRYAPGIDYLIVHGLVVPVADNMPVNCLVLADFEL